MLPMTTDNPPETLRWPREQMEAINQLAEAIRGGGLRDPANAGFIAEQASYYGRRGRYMAPIHPAAAWRAAQQGYDLRHCLGLNGRRQLEEWQRFDGEPDISEIHVDAIMSEISIAYMNDGYIGEQVFPNVQVTKPSDKFFIFDRAAWRRDEGTSIVRGLGAPAARGGYHVSTDSYRVERYTFEHPVDDMMYDAADEPINLQANGVRYCAEKILLRKEKLIAALAFGSGQWTSGTTLSGATQWSHASGVPINNFSTARLAVRQLIGRLPNTLVLGAQTFEALALNAQLIARIQYTGTAESPAMVTAGMIAALAGVERVLVGGVVENTAVEQLPDVETNAFIWGKHALLLYVPGSPAREEPAGGYVFTKGRKADSYREEQTTSDIMRCEEEFDVKKTGADAAYLWTDAVA